MKKYLALKASAGSGKTFALTVRYISLLLLGAKPNEILTLTFTNKAAQEMRERIFSTIYSLGENKTYLEQISLQTKLSENEILVQKKSLLKEFISSELSIYTIDKFINKILREFCGYAGVSDDFEIQNDDIEKLTFKFLHSLAEDDFDSLINFSSYEQKKLNTLIGLFKSMIEKNEDFQVKNVPLQYVEEQKSKVLQQALLIKEYFDNLDDVSKSTKNAVAYNDFESLLTKGKTWLTKNSLSEYSYFKKYKNEQLEEYFYNLKKELEVYYWLKSNYSLYKLHDLFLKFSSFRKEYNKNKNYFEFSDITNLTYTLLSTSIDKEFLYFRLDSKFSHLLIDEFQDTSLLQYKILKPIIDEILSGDQTAFKTFFYVGDTKQSIYRFRGGKRELFDFVATSNSQIEIEALHTNYRSRKNIVNYVNEIFLKLQNYEYFEQNSNQHGGYVEVVCKGEEKQETKETINELYVQIANKIKELLKLGIDANSIAVLTYTNDDVLALYSYLGSQLPTLKISTEMTSKLIYAQNVKAVINAIKYLFFKENFYLENFNALLGNKPLFEVKLEENLLKQNITALIKDIAVRFDLIDENIIKFIEISNKFKDIVDFIYEVDNLDAPIQNKEQSGLQILTIFKSKGLEFDTVLLTDRIKRKNSNKSSLLFEYNGIELNQVHYKIANKEFFDNNYNNALKKEKLLEHDDEINVLYVAMTRAKNNLIIFKKPKNSSFDLLSLKEIKMGELIVENQTKIKSSPIKKVEYTPLDIGKQNIKSQDIEEKEDSLHAKYFGNATHYCLEMLGNFDELSLIKSLQLTKSRYANYLNEQDFNTIKDSIALLLNNQEFKQLISNSTISKEQALIFNNELKIIDLLIKKEDRFIIVDYKTTKEQLQEHIYQVAHYTKAIKNIYPTKEVLGYIVYLKANKTEIVSL